MNNLQVTPAYRIFGGPRQTVSPPGAYPAHPTHAGRYLLDAPEAHISSSWSDAVVPTGAFLRRDGDLIHAKFIDREGKQREIVLNHIPAYQDWLDLKRSKNARRRLPLSDADVEQELLAELMSEYSSSWEGDPRFAGSDTHQTKPKFARNPFGPWSFRINLADGTRGKQHLHTTAENFVAYINSPEDSTSDLYGTLGSSHGCVHIAWKHLKALIALGYVKRGISVVIHHYEQKGPGFREDERDEEVAP